MPLFDSHGAVFIDVSPAARQAAADRVKLAYSSEDYIQANVYLPRQLLRAFDAYLKRHRIDGRRGTITALIEQVLDADSASL